MAHAAKPLNIFDYVQMLLARDSKIIVSRECANENSVHLYGIGQYWAAFDKSAYLLETMVDDEFDAAIIHVKDYPFPLLMYCLHYEKVKSLCRNHIMAANEMDYLKLLGTPISPISYSRWYRRHLNDILQ